MKHPKRFCVKCNKEGRIYALGQMWRCRVCKEEICRLGDGLPNRNFKMIGFLDMRGGIEDGEAGVNPVELARERPELLSDEHKLWESRPWNSEDLDRVHSLRILKAFTKLTGRQKEIVTALQKHKTQEKAAKALGVSREAIKMALIAIRKKLATNLDKSV